AVSGSSGRKESTPAASRPCATTTAMAGWAHDGGGAGGSGGSPEAAPRAAHRAKTATTTATRIGTHSVRRRRHLYPDGGMELEITPEPTPEERAAIVAALEQVLVAEDGTTDPGRWWEAGLRDGLDGA